MATTTAPPIDSTIDNDRRATIPAPYVTCADEVWGTELLGALTETALQVGQARADGTPVADTLRAQSRVRSPRLTAAQRRRVRELVDDEGWTRSAAVKLVLEGF